MSTRVLVLLLALAGCNRATVVLEPEDPTPPTPTPVQQQGHEDVREAARQYAAALSKRDPAAASEWVVAETFDYFEDLRIAALRGSREQLERWDLMSVIQVLQIRATLVRSELEAADGRALFERAVSEGLVGSEVEQVPVDEVWIDDDGLHAQIQIEGEPVIWLRREPEQHWCIDIPEMIRVLGPAIEAVARERVIADGKLRTALTFVELSSEDSIDIAVLDGPRE